MGIILADQYTSPQGLTLANVYISFANNTLTCTPLPAENTKNFVVSALASVFANRATRDNGDQELTTRLVTAANIPALTAPYANLYAELKAGFPNSADD